MLPHLLSVMRTEIGSQFKKRTLRCQLPNRCCQLDCRHSRAFYIIVPLFTTRAVRRSFPEKSMTKITTYLTTRWSAVIILLLVLGTFIYIGGAMMAPALLDD